MSNTKPDSSQVKFIPAGTSAVVTTVQDKLRESVSVKDFGALVDGTTDDTAAYLAALAAASMVTIPAGTMIISSVPVPTNRTIKGAGRNATTIKLNAASNTALHTIANVNDVEFMDLTLNGNSTNNLTGGIGAYASGASSRIRFNNVRATDFRLAGIAAGPGTSHIEALNCQIDNNLMDGFQMTGVAYPSVLMSEVSNNVRYGAVFGSACAFVRNLGNVLHSNGQGGFIMVGGNDAVTAANISTANGGHGLQYNGTLRGTYTGNISTVNSGSGFDFTLGSSYGLATGNIGFQNSWRGVEVDSQSLHCSIVGNSFYQNYESGMTNFSSSECIYMGNQVVDNNLGNTTFSGIDITTDGVNPANNILLLGNVAIGHGLHQAYGLNISSSSPESFGVIIDGNSFAGNAIGSVNLGTTTGVQAMNNLAWTTQAKGTGSIAAGATNSGPIAHGLALTPTYSSFVLEFANGPAFAIGTVWIDNITATHFTVYCMTAPGGAGINFGWAANKY